MPALLRAMTKAHRAARGASVERLDPVAATAAETRRVSVAEALRARFADMAEEPEAFGTSKGEIILRMMDSEA